MAKFRPQEALAPPGIKETKVFTDPLQPGREMPITLFVEPDYSFQLALSAKSAEYVADYITGRDGLPPSPLPPVCGGVIYPTEALMSVISFFLLTEQAQGEEPPYDFVDWLAFSKAAPNAFEELIHWSNSLRERASALAKNA